MKVYTHNSASQLFERVESLDQVDHDHWRCVYLKLYDKQERMNHMLRTNFINRAIVDILDKDEGHIYFCEDGDIFILFEGALKPLLARLSTHFGDLDPDQLRGQPNESMFTFFDLSKHWQGFYNICREKASRNILARNRLPAALPVAAEANRVSANA